MEKLKPCPFCGGKAEMDRHFFYIGSNTYGVECNHCGVKTHQFYISEEAAAKAWNRRAEAQRIKYTEMSEDERTCD